MRRYFFSLNKTNFQPKREKEKKSADEHSISLHHCPLNFCKADERLGLTPIVQESALFSYYSFLTVSKYRQDILMELIHFDCLAVLRSTVFGGVFKHEECFLVTLLSESFGQLGHRRVICPTPICFFHSPRSGEERN